MQTLILKTLPIQWCWGPPTGVLTDPANGNTVVTTGAIAGQTLTYTPNTDFTGSDTFTYAVNDGASDSATKTATISVSDAMHTQTMQIGYDDDGEAWRDESGTSVALSSDGRTLAVGAYLNDGIKYGSNAGHERASPIMAALAKPAAYPSHPSLRSCRIEGVVCSNVVDDAEDG